MNTLPLILELNDFANLCGHFYNAELSDGISANNGYNCRHPEQEEFRDDEECGVEVGCCFAWGCPLGYAPSYEELIEHGVIDEDDVDPSTELEFTCHDYIVVTDTDTANRLRGGGENGLATK